MYDQAHMTSKDAPKNIVINFDDNSITLSREDPFGFVRLALAKGTLPKDFQGLFTSFTLAEQAAKEYIEQNKKKVDGPTKSNSRRE